VPEHAEPAIADAGGWPRVTKIHAAGGHTAKTAHHRRRVAERDRDITASISAKKSKTKTADTGFTWNWFQR
jgi:hypothetical protein